MKHTHVHTKGAEGIIWINTDGQLIGTSPYAKHLIDMFGASGKSGPELLDFIKEKLDPALMATTIDCDEDGHIQAYDAAGDDKEMHNVDPRVTDNWQDYQGEGEREHRDISFGNDTMYLP